MIKRLVTCLFFVIGFWYQLAAQSTVDGLKMAYYISEFDFVQQHHVRKLSGESELHFHIDENALCVEFLDVHINEKPILINDNEEGITYYVFKDNNTVITTQDTICILKKFNTELVLSEEIIVIKIQN